MASKVSGVIEKINVSGTERAIASSAYGYCETAAGTAAKVVDMTDFKLYEGVTIHVKFKEKNSAANPTLNVQGTGAKPIVMYGTTATPSNDDTNSWYAGAILSLTYDGTSWVKSQAINTNTWRGIVDNLTSSTATTTSLSGKQGYLLANGDARDNTKLPLAGGTMTGDILGNSSVALGTAANPFHNIVLGGTTNATMSASSTNPRITFQESTGTQPVHLIYTDYDNYRSPAGLKIIGGALATPAWLEVEGNIYAAAFKGKATSAYHASAAHWYTQAGSPTGILKIKIKKKQGWMLAFTVRVYQAYCYDDYVISGYNYDSNKWYAAEATLLASESTEKHTVTFGYDDDTDSNNFCTLWVSIPVKQYTGIDIFNVTNGYSQITDISDTFEIIQETTSTGTVQTTVDCYRPWYRNEKVSNASNADTVNGLTVQTAVPANAVFTDTNKYHKTGSWSGLTYTATAVNSADELKFTIPNKIQTNWELNATSGNSPALLFTRDGGLTDWRIIVTSGRLSFQSATDASTWTERAYFKDNTGDFVATSFTGKGSDLTDLNGSNISSGTVAAARIDSAIARLASPAFTGTPTAPTAANGTNTTQIATTAFVNNTLAYINAMVFKGTLGTGGTVTSLPASHNAGDTYRVITAGTWAGKYCEVGTLIICVKDGTTAADADWTSVETNEDGTIIGSTPTSSTDNAIVRWDGAAGRVIQNSGITIDDNNIITSTGSDINITAYKENEGDHGIFFRSGFFNNSANKYNLSITTYDHSSNGATPDGLSINANDGISFCTGSNTRNERMRITTGGFVGIGTISPSTKLHVHNGDLTISKDGTTTDNTPAKITFTTKDTTKNLTSSAYIAVYNDHATTYNTNMVINSSGNTFIGAGESASTIYSAKGSTFSGENLFLSADSIVYVYAYADTAANRIGFAVDTTGNVIPQKAEAKNNNAQNLGASDNKWANVYATAFKGNADTATSAGKWTTARTLTIGNKGQSVDGSGDVSWSLADIGAAPSSTISCTATNIESALGIDFITHAGALNTNGWKTMGARSSGAKIAIAYNNNPAAWNSQTYSASIVFGCNDTKGLLDCGYNSPIVTFGGSSNAGGTDNDPNWYFKLSGTSGQTYTFPSTSKTLAASDGSNASGSWGISITGNSANVTGTVAIANGGTGATTAAAARTNLGLGTAAIYNITGGNEGYSTSATLIPRIGTDGVMEVGKYIDFHASTGTSKDYDVRITAAATGLTISGTTSGTFSGNLTGNVTGNVSGSAGSVAWANVTGKPDSFTPAAHEHNRLNSIGRLTTAATIPYNPSSAGNLFRLVWNIYDSSSRTNDANGSPSFDASVINLPWDWGGYNGQIAISSTGKVPRLQIRSANHVDHGEGANPRYTPDYGVWREVVTATKATKVGDTNKPIYIDANGQATAISYTIGKSVPTDAVFTDTTSFTITANATDGLWDLTGTNGTNAVTYALAPYSSKGTTATFYTAATNPTLTTRLNYDGYLYATKLYSGGTEVSVSGHTHPVSQLTWGGGVNLATTATANNQEWSIDLSPGTYTGTYWHVWSTPKGGSILTCHPDDRHVTMPGNIASTSTSTGTLQVTGGIGATGQITATRLAANGSDTAYNLYVNGPSYSNINAYMPYQLSLDNPKVSRKLTEHNTSSYRHWIVLLLPYQTATNTSINNYIHGHIHFKKTGSNIYDEVFISANLCYNQLKYRLETYGDGGENAFTPISCIYNGVKYFALKCYDHDNPWTEIYFDGYCISAYPGGNNTTTKPLTLPYIVNYKGNGTQSGSQTIVNTEINNSISTILTDSIVTTATRYYPYMNINGSASSVPWTGVSNRPTNLNQFTNGPGYVTSSGVTSITLKAGTGIKLDTDNTAITTTGTRTISINGIDATNGDNAKCLTQKGNWVAFNSYSHPTGDGNLHVPATGTSNNGKVLKAGSTAGSISWGTLSASDVGALASGTTVTNVAISADTTTNKNYALVFGTTPSDGTSPTAAKTESLQKNSAKFYVNPSTGNLQATTFNGYTLAAASAKAVVTSIDSSASLPTSNAVKTFVEGKGYVTSSGVTSITLKAGAGITLDTNNTAITSTGTRTISINGMNTSSGSTTKWLNQKGGWSTPSASDVGALSSSTTVTNVAISADITTNKNYAVVFGTTPSDGTQPTAAKTEGLQKNISKFYFNPYEGNLNATSFSVDESVTLKYNTTDSALEFVFG